MELFKASQQWSTRPADETFETIKAAYDASVSYANTAHEKMLNPASLRVEAIGPDVQLVGKGNTPAVLTNWAFGQLSAFATAPAGYLRKLPPTLAAQNLNYGLKERFGTSESPNPDNAKLNMLAHVNGGIVVRSLNSERYSRIWNHELLLRMLDFADYGWTNPNPFKTKAEDHGIGKGDPTIYVSDHDMFVFQVNNQNRIAEPGNPEGLGRGFFVENSEVGAAKVRITTFLYRYMCCNHIIWGAKNVSEIAVRHVGSAHDRVLSAFGNLSLELKRYANTSASDDEAKIASAKSKMIDAKDKDSLLDFLFTKLRGAATRTQLEESHNLAVQHEDTDGNAGSYWGFAQGMTRYSQTLPYADARVSVDRAAGKVLEMAF
jgi:hypothetical protein